MNRTLWKDDFLWEVYELAKEGTTERQIAKIIGVSLQTHIVWEKKKALYRLALKKGRYIYHQKQKSGKSAISEYIYDRLSKDEKKIWKKLKLARKSRSGAETVNAIFAGRGKEYRQHLFVYAMCHTNFQRSKACALVGISHETLNKWLVRDPEFVKLFKAIEEAKRDLFEDSFIRLVKDRNPSVVIYAAKTQLKERGYGEKQEIDVNVSGTVNHSLVEIDVAALPLELQKGLLEHIRQTKQIESTVVDSVPVLPAIAESVANKE